MAIKGAKGKAGRLVAWVVVGLLVVGLAGFGATNFGGSANAVGHVGETEISVDDYANALQQELRSLEERAGRSISMQEAQQFGVQQAVLSRVVAEAALTEETRRLGMSAGDARVRDEIVAIPAFQGLDGSFDREAYESALDRANLSVDAFESQIRGDVARGFLTRAVTGGVETPPVYVDTLFEYAREMRDFSWVQIGPDALEQELPEPDEETLRAFHEENAADFTSPETRVVTYAWITPEMMLEEIAVDEDELRALYDERGEEYVQPERRIVDRLTFSDADAAQQAADAIAAGETDFETLIEERDLTLGDVELGEVSREDLGQAAEEVFAREEPGIVGPVETGEGPALFRVNAVLSAQEVPFEDVRPDLLAEVAADRATRAIGEMRDDLTDRLAGGETMEQLAEETALELGEVAIRPGADDPALDYQAFREAADAAQVDDFPELRELEDGGVFALRLDAVEPPREQPFEEVRDEVAASWRAAETTERLLARAEEIAAEIEAGATFEELGLDPGSAEDAVRDGVIEGVPAAAIEAVFEMSPGAARAVPAAEEAVVVRLEDVSVPEGDTDEAQAVKADFAQRSSQAIANDLLEAFTRSVQTDAGLSLNQEVINAVHSQISG